MSYETFVGLRHLRSKKKSFISTITLFSILGVVLGVATLSSVVSVTGGFQEAFRQKVLGINSHILVMKYGINFREYRDTMKTIEEVEGVEATSPFIFHEMMMSHDKRISGVLIKGIDPDRSHAVSDLPQYVTEGSIADLKWSRPPQEPTPIADLLDPKAFEAYKESNKPDALEVTPGIMVGSVLAERMKIRLGDEVTLVSPLRGLNPDTWAPTQMAPTSRKYTLAGIYRSGFHEYDSKLVMVDYHTLQDFFNQGDVVTGVEIRVSDVFAVGEIGQDIKGRLTPGRFRTLDWREINRNLFTSLKLQKLVLAIILTFIVIVASFNIVSTLIMLVLDKAKEISILKSMGASSGGVMRIFMLEGLVIGTIGTVFGLVGGVLVCLFIGSFDFGMDPKVYLIDQLPVRMQLWEFAAIGMISMSISFLATLYPSYKAAKMPPAEGLRYD